MSDEQFTWLEKLSHFLSREPHTQAQLIEMLRDAHEHELIDRDALQMIEGVLAVSEKQVRDIMVPRSQMIVVSGDQLPNEVLSLVIHSQHSRFPVIDENPDKVLGVLLAKDLLPFFVDPKPEPKPVSQFIRSVVFIPESKPLDVLLKEFRQNRNHMAIVVDEYGLASGLVTIEDVLEEIVGDIQDEYDIDEKESTIRLVKEDIYAVHALTPIDEFNDYFDTHFSNEDFDTIGGLITQQFGRVPKRNESITFGGFDILVIRASRRGIQSLQFKRIKTEEDE